MEYPVFVYSRFWHFIYRGYTTIWNIKEHKVEKCFAVSYDNSARLYRYKKQIGSEISCGGSRRRYTVAYNSQGESSCLIRDSHSYRNAMLKLARQYDEARFSISKVAKVSLKKKSALRKLPSLQTLPTCQQAHSPIPIQENHSSYDRAHSSIHSNIPANLLRGGCRYKIRDITTTLELHYLTLAEYGNMGERYVKVPLFFGEDVEA